MTATEHMQIRIENVGAIVTGTILTDNYDAQEVRIIIPRAECEIIGNDLRIKKLINQ